MTKFLTNNQDLFVIQADLEGADVIVLCNGNTSQYCETQDVLV